MTQLLLFPELEKSEEELLREEVVKLRETCEKVRKGQYARIAEVTKIVLETRNELEMLKAAIVKNSKFKAEDT